jgi:transposase
MTSRKSKAVYCVNEADRHRVELLVSVGHSHEHIANVLGISVSMLKQYFKDQLKHGAARTEAALVEKLWDGATKERSGASQRALAKMIDKSKATTAREKAREAKEAPRPGIDREMTGKERDILARWAHHCGSGAWAALVPDPPGEQMPDWVKEYITWLKAIA